MIRYSTSACSGNFSPAGFDRAAAGHATIFAMRLSLLGILLLVTAALLPAAKNLEVYSIDVEGGQATLFVAPGGDSMLVDTGWAGYNRRDAGRILAAAKSAGVKKIDYLVTTHYHADHVGGVPQLNEKIPIRNFVDHGASVESGKDANVLFNAYKAFRDKGNHIQVKPGDTIPVKGLDVKVLSSAGELIASPLPGAGQPNPECSSFQKHDADATRERAVGGHSGDLRQFPHDRPGRPDLEQGVRPGLPQQQDRPRGRLPGLAPRHQRVQLAATGACPGAARGRS